MITDFLSLLNKNKHLLILFYFLLLPFGGLYVVYCSLILLISFTSIRYNKKEFSSNYFFYLFILIWIPMLLSLIDAINFDRSFIKTMSLLPFLFVGLYLSTGLSTNRIYFAMSILVFATGIWCLDFFIYHMRIIESEHAFLWRWSFSIEGDFYIPILGQVLSVLLPIIFEALRKYADTKVKISISLIFVVIYITTILLSGNRNAVIMMCLSLIAWLFYVDIKCKYLKTYPKIILSIMLIAVVYFSTLLSMNSTRLVSFVDVESTDIQAIDNLSSNRLPLWESAFKMAKDNWFNGIGPRGFRYGYDAYRPDVGKYAIEYEYGSTHPHFALLEIFLETGIIGLFSLFLLFWMIFKEILKANKDIQILLVPWFIALTTAIIPNIGKAFYSSYWLTFIVFLLIGCTSIMNLNKQSINIVR